ncbi:MAG: HAD-IC family P-type ATPase, partial [Propionibacteriaceae bacterium]|nr:HAD-IC family P-type ATPase [Propionibacteriaceae bacterium]
VLRASGISELVRISGDTQQVADAVGRSVGIDRAVGELLPEDKVVAIRDLTRDGRITAMVGDGVNDAPAMASASLGIAMGAAGSAVALETADIALMSDDLGRVPFMVRLSRATSRLIRQNLIAALVIVAFLVPASLLGLAMGPIVFIHEGSTILVVLNALRLLRFDHNRDHHGITHEDRPTGRPAAAGAPRQELTTPPHTAE